ncbi:MAG: hypothetical protein EBV06_01990 [Planctomycetia bacterium]|nr:hypothetical protein [Planctomycetia bacterium]
MSWSTDCTIKLWDVASGREMAMFASHTDRVTSVAISPDGTLAISGSRDSTIRLWDLEHFVELASVNIGSDVRVCFFLLDGESVVVADGLGRVFAMSLPTFEVRAQIQIPFHPLCGALAPTGLQIALGGEDGIVHFIDLEDQLRASFLVTALPCTRHEPTLLNKLFGGTRTTRKYRFMCPSCRREIESPVIPAVVTACPGCRRPLRVRSQPALTQ